MPSEDSAVKAQARLEQVTSHISRSANSSANTSKTRRRKKEKTGEDELPADYSDILGQIATLKKIAATPNTSARGYIRQKQAGKLWVRERVDALLDPGSFKEVGSVSGEVKWKKVGYAREEPMEYVPSNNVQGFGTLKGRRIVFTVDDFSLRAGHADGALYAKTLFVEDLALAMKIPIVKLVDGSSGGGSVTTIEKEGWSYLPAIRNFNVVCKQLNAGIPNLGAVVGPAIGLGAARVVACHFSVMAADIGSLFNAGPNVVANATFEEGLGFTDLGGPMMHCTNGTIDNIAPDEAGCYEQLRNILQYLPNHGLEAPPVLPCNDPDDRSTPSMRTLVPRRRERMFPAYKLLEIVDKDSWFEIGALWGRTAICGLARLAGYPVGIIINNSEVNGGALDTPGSQKLTKHLKFLDVFNIPLVQFIDVPGFAIGTVAERTATMRWGVGLAGAYCGTTMPVFNVLTRKAYGVAGQLMIAAREPRTLVAWPSGEWGSLPLAGGIEVGHAYELKQLEKEKGPQARQERYDELMEKYRRLQNPVRTANAFGVEEIIDPADTRQLLCTWVRHVYDTLMPIRLAERANGKIAPMFY